jgi:hypothetical protein
MTCTADRNTCNLKRQEQYASIEFKVAPLRKKKYSFFYDVTQRWLLVTDTSGLPIGPVLKCQAVTWDPQIVPKRRKLSANQWRVTA